MEKIMWVGVRFNPEEDYDNKYVREQNRIISHKVADWLLFQKHTPRMIASPQAVIHEFGDHWNPTIEVTTPSGDRIGFGMRVSCIEHGRAKIDGVTNALHMMHITLPVAIWEWTPGQPTARPAGIDEMVTTTPPPA